MSYFGTSRFGNIPPVVKNLLIINILLLFGTFAIQKAWGVDLTRLFGLYYFQSEYFRPYQFITHMFMHGGLTHLFFNMFALWIFGKVLEGVWGPKRFFIYYMVTGLGAAALHTFVNWIELSSLQSAATAFSNTPSPELYAEFIKAHVPTPNRQVYDFITRWGYNPNNPEYIRMATAQIQNFVASRLNIPTVGASGAIFGVLLAFGMLFPNTQLMLLFLPIPIKAKYLVIFYAILEIWLGFTQPGSNVAHFAHVGGMLFGFILIKYWSINKKTFY